MGKGFAGDRPGFRFSSETSVNPRGVTHPPTLLCASETRQLIPLR